MITAARCARRQDKHDFVRADSSARYKIPKPSYYHHFLNVPVAGNRGRLTKKSHGASGDREYPRRYSRATCYRLVVIEEIVVLEENRHLSLQQMVLVPAQEKKKNTTESLS